MRGVYWSLEKESREIYAKYKGFKERIANINSFYRRIIGNFYFLFGNV